MSKLIERYEAELDIRHRQGLKRLYEITKMIEKDKLKSERDLLFRRGVVRGRR